MPRFGQAADDAVYFVTAKAIAEGSGYRILSLPDEPYQTKYPPLFPLLLSCAWKLNPSFPANLPLALLFVWPIFPLYLLIAWRLFGRLVAR